MSRLIWAILLLLPAVQWCDAAECSNTKPCSGGECCSKYGFCGNSANHCGDGCQSNCKIKQSACDAERHCANNECCSQMGYCGTTADHCGPGCLSNCRATNAPKGNCDANRKCPENQCCSQYGYCGVTADHCGKGCLSNCRDSEPNPATSVGQCDAIRLCTENLCCSQYNYCGNEADHCSTGCLSNCWTNVTAFCSAANPCADGTCCSKYGYCGTTGDHCGDGCLANCRNGDSNSLGKPFQSITSCKFFDSKKKLLTESNAWLCDGCPYLTWNTAPNISLTTQPSYLISTNDVSQCFYSCLERDCVVFTMDRENQTCSIYEEYGSWSLTSELIFVTSYFRKIESTVLLEEWIFSQPSSIDGKPFHNEVLEGEKRTFAGCLFLCMFNYNNRDCRAIDFSANSGECRLFDANEGAVTRIVAKMTSIQHISILRQDNQWRFQSLRGRTFLAAPYLILSSIAIDDCLGECMEDKHCQGATIQGRGVNRDCYLVNDTNGDWEATKDQVISYILHVPAAKESLRPMAAESSPMVFWNADESHVISRIQNIPNIAECINTVNTNKFDTVSKITYIEKTKECVLLPDWAQITEPLEVSESPIQSYIVQAKRQWQFYGFKRIPGLYAPGVRTPQIFRNEQSVEKCLNTCLIGHTCSAVVAIYNNTESQLYCYYYTDIDLINVTLTADPSSEMFYKLELVRMYYPTSSNPIDMCAYGGDVEQTPASLSTLLQLNQTVWDLDELSPNTLKISPHGDTFGGIPVDSYDPEANVPLSTFKKRRRSVPKFTSTHERQRRGLFGDIWNGIKKVGGAMVDGVKEVGKVVKKGVETVLKPIDDLIKPVTTWVDENIVSPIMDNVIDPILKPVRDFIEPVAGPVMDFLDDILPDSPTFDIITGGGIRKKILKGNKDVKGKTDTPDKDVKKKTDKENKDKRDADNDRCERAQKRPNSCTNNKRDVCVGPRIKNGGQTYKSCTGKKDNQKCNLECQDGYQPSNNQLTCNVPRKGQPYWTPKNAKCDVESCNDLPFIQVRPTGQKNSKFPIYLVKYQKSKKIPLWSMYYHSGTIGTVPNVAKAFRQYPCGELKGFQLGNIDYRRTGYDRGHLAPQNAFRLDPRSNSATNLYINVAPQDPWTNQNPWKNLEGKVETHRGLIVTGVCTSALAGARTKKLPVPKCYWKLVCTRNNRGKHTAAAFFHDNTAPKSQTAKKNRNAQVAQPLNQLDVRNFIGTGEYGQIWTAATKYLPINMRGKRAITDDVVNPVECAAQQTLSEEDKQFWATMIDLNSWNTNWDDPNDEDVDDDDDASDELDDEQLDLDGCDDSCNNSPTCGRKVIGYYTSWGKNLLRAKQASYLTHVIFAFIEMKADGSLHVGSADPTNTQDYDKDAKLAKARLDHLVRLKKAVGGHLKTMFAVGGWENSQYYSSVAADDGLTSNYIKSAMEIMLQYDFDGIDIDWEYPVTGGAHDGTTNDKQNYVKFLKTLRSNLNYLQAKTGRSNPYLITIASAAGSWVLEVGYDLEEIIKIVDWINVMTYDYYGAWTSKWGAYTGPIAPLYFGTPDRYSGKMNVDFTMKFYVCRTEMSQKIVIGLGFYGRYWNNVGAQVKSGDDLWRMSEPISGGFASYRDIKKDWMGKPGYKQEFHDATKTPFLWSESERSLMAYEDEKSLLEKVKYAASHNLGGVMIWAVDLDDDEMNLLRTVSSDAICGGGGAAAYKCNPLHDKRWWTPENDEKENAGMCGHMAPLYEGYYPLCDPDDPGYSCCGKWGYCGKGPDFCDCPECVNYGEEPSKTLDEPIKPTRSVQWHFLNADIPVGQPRCGPNAPKLNGKYAICNPDSFFYCCSSGGYCGNTDEFCKCDGCINFKENPNYEYPN